MAKITRHRLLLFILALALAFRLIFALSQDPLAPYADRSNDDGWYLGNAYALVTGQSPAGMITNVSNLASPPLYFILIGVPQAFLSPAAAVIAVRILQALLSTATCFFAYRLAVLLTHRPNAGLLAAFVLAISPAFIVESAQILTETTYIAFLAGGVWLYVESVTRRGNGEGSDERTGRILPLLILAAILFGLATLTRAVLLAFPFGIALHLLAARGWRKGWRQVALFLLVYAIVVSSWTIYSLARWNRFVIAGTGLPAFLYIGATGWTSAQQVDQSLQSANGDFMQGAADAIGSNPVGWVKHRLSELASAYFQPHGTTFYGGASLKDLTLTWLRQDRSLAGLIALIQSDSFVPKLALYIFHYAALIFGVIGIWLYRRRWLVALPMVGLIVYVTLVHFALLALPRYLFPNEVFWWIFAAAALNYLFVRRTQPYMEAQA